MAEAAVAESSEPGAIERQVQRDIAAMVTAHPMGEALTEIALTLARTLDGGAGLQTASVSRELRATLNDLAGQKVGDGDEFDPLSEPSGGAELPSADRDASKS